MAVLAHLRKRGLDGGGPLRPQHERGPCDDLPRGQVRVAIAEPQLGRHAALRPLGGNDLDPLERFCKLAAVGVCVHPHRAADGAGDIHPELDPRQPRLRRARRDRRQPGATATHKPLPFVLDQRELAVELHHQATHTLVGNQQVRAGPDDGDLGAYRLRPREQLLQLGARTGPGEILGLTTGPHRRHPVERVVALHDRRHRRR